MSPLGQRRLCHTVGDMAALHSTADQFVRGVALQLRATSGHSEILRSIIEAIRRVKTVAEQMVRRLAARGLSELNPCRLTPYRWRSAGRNCGSMLD
jgi:hypothetical protein